MEITKLFIHPFSGGGEWARIYLEGGAMGFPTPPPPPPDLLF